MGKSTKKVYRRHLLMSGAQIWGELNYKYRKINSDRTLDDDDIVILACADTTAITVSLPDASDSEGRIYHVKKIDSSGSPLTIDGAGTETIDGGATAILNTQYESISIVCDRAEWWIF